MTALGAAVALLAACASEASSRQEGGNVRDSSTSGAGPSDGGAGAADATVGQPDGSPETPSVDGGDRDSGSVPDPNPNDGGVLVDGASEPESDAGGGPPPANTPQIPSPPLASVETDSFSLNGTADISDDSAIYANPNAPELSVVVADNKDTTTGGVGVFDMKGSLLQFRQDGMIGNIDLRSGFILGGAPIVLVGANNRSDDSLIFWRLDPATRQLSAPIGAAAPTISPSYGFCLYHSATSGKFFAFVTQETGSSTMEQYELGERGGKVTASKVRSFQVGSITEGCVADDELGRLYVAQEDVALWKYGAEPSAGSSRTQVAAVGDGHVVADLEGVSVAKGPGTSGYLVISLQGENRFALFDRMTNAFIRDFTVGANGAVDAVSQTDGLDISTSNLGPGFTHGALVVHDGSNTGGTTSNLKYIPLQ